MSELNTAIENLLRAVAKDMTDPEEIWGLAEMAAHKVSAASHLLVRKIYDEKVGEQRIKDQKEDNPTPTGDSHADIQATGGIPKGEAA